MGQQTKAFGQPGSVPMTVSRQHCSLTVNDNGTYTLRNLKPQNYTFVNGQLIMSKVVTRRDIIQLGSEMYLVDWNAIDAIVPKMADITHLKKVWDDYDNTRTQMAIKRGRSMAIRGATSLLTMGAFIIMAISGQRGSGYLALYITAFVILAALTVLSFYNASKEPMKQKELNKKFQKDYCCPSCGHFLGFQDYAIIEQNKSCPYCKTLFLK